MQKKILFFNGFYPYVRGGAELQAKIIALQAKANNYEIVFVSIEEVDNEVVIRENIKVYIVPNPNKVFNNITLYYFFMKKMIRIIEIERPSIIYQRILNSFSPYIAKYSNANNIPFVLHIANTHCFKFSNSFRDKVRLFLFNQLKKYKVKFIAQTKEQEELLEQHGMTSSMVIPNFYNAYIDFTNRTVTSLDVLWVANIRPVKQVELFLKLAFLLKDTPLKFFIIGRVEDETKEIFYIDKMNKASNVEYLGELSIEQVDKRMREAFVLANTSRSEGFPNTFIQAWSCGVPVVSLNADPNTYIVNNNVGFFAAGNMEKMKGALLAYIRDSDLHKTHSLNSRRLCQNELSFEKNSKKLIEFFENC